ncbi:MAG: RNA ligase family protein [Planctomycetaceae bacterium]
MTFPIKPLNQKAYGSIGHLPNSRLGPGDHRVPDGQAKICCVKTRDKHDRIIVQEKLDGSCVAVALLDGVLVPLGRAGHPAISSRYEQHRLFDQWVRTQEDRFRAVLREGERIVGEWLALAHGTKYDLSKHEPFGAFDIMTGTTRLVFDEFTARVQGHFATPHLLHDGGAISVEAAMALHGSKCWPSEELEGVVYRVERKGEVELLAKYVRPDKIDGKYLSDISGQPDVWNWRPNW